MKNFLLGMSFCLACVLGYINGPAINGPVKTGRINGIAIYDFSQNGDPYVSGIDPITKKEFYKYMYRPIWTGFEVYHDIPAGSNTQPYLEYKYNRFFSWNCKLHIK
jgi:hypothetical protein